MTVDWSDRAGYIFAKHEVTTDQADDALTDPNGVVFDPDYNSNSGEGVRTIGYSTLAREILTVITVEFDGIVYGANAWKANARHRRYYNQGGPDA